MEQVDNTTEENRRMALQQRRSSAIPKPVQKQNPPTQSGIGINGIGLLIIAGLFDLLSLIPLIGHLLGIAGSFILWLWVKISGLDKGKPWFISWGGGISSGVKLIPFVSALPSCLSYVSSVLFFETSVGKQIKQLSSPTS